MITRHYAAAPAFVLVLGFCAFQHAQIASLREQLLAERANTRALNAQIKALRAAKPAPAPEITRIKKIKVKDESCESKLQAYKALFK